MIQDALRKIQVELKCAKTLHNNFGNFNYRNVESILEALKPLLKENNCILTLSDDIVMVGDRFYIKATATITQDKESISTSAFAREALDKKGMDTAQITGACSSYARKYALGGLFLLDDNEDIDSKDNRDIKANSSKKETKQVETENLSPSQQVLNLLLNAGLTKTDIQNYMAKKGFKSSDTEQMKLLLEHKDEFLQDAISYLINL